MEKANVKASMSTAQLDGNAEQKRIRELQEKYAEYQLLEEQIKQVQQQIQKMDSQLADLESIHEGLEDFKNAAEGSEVFVPVSNGIFLQANLASNKKLLVNVGSSVVVEKTVDDTKKLLGDQQVEISMYREQLLAHLNKLPEQMQHLQAQLEKMIREQRPEHTH
ncbi:prefoldin subunit alpha [Candidatus Woesearchaeota archaeon]|nr:prefoldin subunit alpha [Candidatus Woesearchaeota archaeon]